MNNAIVDRRAFLGGLVAAAVAPSAALAGLQCTPPAANGVKLCQVGLVMPFVRAEQQNSNWCWAACIQMIFRVHGFQVAQETIVARAFGTAINSPAEGLQIFRDINGSWRDETNGRRFSAAADVLWDAQQFLGRPDALQRAAWELNNDNPLIVGALGHATMLTALSYYLNPLGQVQLTEIVVRDPWPANPPRRTMAPYEAMSANFLAAVRVRAG